MSWLPLALLVLSQPPEVKLASPGLTGVQVEKNLMHFFSEHLAQQLTLRGLRVISTSEIETLLGLERQKALMGCTDTSCTAELANALGVDGIILGSIGKFDEEFQINVKVIAARDGRTLAAHSGTAARQSEVLAVLNEAASRMADEVARSLHRPVAEGARRFAWIPGAAAVVGLGLGTVMMFQVADSERALRGPEGMASSLTPSDAADVLRDARTKQAIGITALAVGSAAAVASGMLLVFGAPPVAVSASVSPQGASVQLGGTFP